MSAFAFAYVARPAFAVGALAIGKCGAYGRAFDHPDEESARSAATKHCDGVCEAVTMKRACAAFSLDMLDPCGAHGYAIAPHISSAENEEMRKCANAILTAAKNV
jgi:hypothetical protein